MDLPSRSLLSLGPCPIIRSALSTAKQRFSSLFLIGHSQIPLSSNDPLFLFDASLTQLPESILRYCCSRCDQLRHYTSEVTTRTQGTTQNGPLVALLSSFLEELSKRHSRDIHLQLPNFRTPSSSTLNDKAFIWSIYYKPHSFTRMDHLLLCNSLNPTEFDESMCHSCSCQLLLSSPIRSSSHLLNELTNKMEQPQSGFVYDVLNRRNVSNPTLPQISTAMIISTSVLARLPRRSMSLQHQSNEEPNTNDRRHPASIPELVHRMWLCPTVVVGVDGLTFQPGSRWLRHRSAEDHQYFDSPRAVSIQILNQ